MIDDFKPVGAPKPPAKLTRQTAELPETSQPSEPTPEPAFKTPDEVAVMDMPLTLPDAPGPKRSRTTPWWKPRFSWPPGKKEYITIVAGLLLIGGAGYWSYTNLHQPPKVEKTPVVHVKKAPPKPTTVPSSLSGLPVDPSVNQRPVIGVMVENSLEARPQSGIIQASVVFEAIAEGGITRFLTLFQDTQPGNIGPVRSARPYYVQWALGFDAAYGHVGGSPEALQDIKTWGVKNLDQFANGGSYHRISSRDAPHNVYTGIPTLSQLAISKGYTSSTFSGFPRKKEAPSKQPNAVSIDLAVSSALYNAHYDYDTASNSYKRSEGGKPHLDADTGAQITPKVVVALVMQYGLEADDHHSSYNTIGSGAAYIFQDGTVTQGTWSKLANGSQITFTDSAGQPIQFNPGQTWLTAVNASSKVTYK